jgi:arylsulfatase A-like enzyme
MRTYSWIFLLACLLTGLLGLDSVAQTPPNILVFIADDAGWRDFGCYGNEAIRTPNIDRLSAGGLTFDNAYLTTPQCSPTRTSLLSGQFAHTIRTEDLHEPLPEEVKILPGLLSEAGYYTALMGKAHIGRSGIDQFDDFFPGQGNPFTADFPRVLEAAGDRPFFAWYAFSDPHRAYQPGSIPEPHEPAEVVVPPYLADTPETRADLALYYDEIGRMDSQIGEVLDMLEQEDKLDNTFIIFLSDNGKPFTRAKGSLYDEGIRTPLIMHWPAVLSSGERRSGLFSLINLAPGLLEAAGREAPAEMYGRSFLEAIRGGADTAFDEYIFAERNWHDCDEHMRAIRSDSFKLIFNAYIDLPHGTAADLAGSPSHQALLRLKESGQLSREQELVFEVPRPMIELYQVWDDPFEFDNLAYDAAYRPIISKLFGRLSDWMVETKDFDPHYRRRYDNTDRVSGAIFIHGRPGYFNPLPETGRHLNRIRRSGFEE